jgi:hypothetical protein
MPKTDLGSVPEVIESLKANLVGVQELPNKQFIAATGHAARAAGAIK